MSRSYKLRQLTEDITGHQSVAVSSAGNRYLYITHHARPLKDPKPCGGILIPLPNGKSQCVVCRKEWEIPWSNLKMMYEMLVWE